MEAEPPFSRFCRTMERAETGQDILSCSPFSAAEWHGKNPFCQGQSEAARVEICEANTTRPFTKWIGISPRKVRRSDEAKACPTKSGLVDFAIAKTACPRRGAGGSLPHHFGTKWCVLYPPR